MPEDGRYNARSCTIDSGSSVIGKGDAKDTCDLDFERSGALSGMDLPDHESTEADRPRREVRPNPKLEELISILRSSSRSRSRSRSRVCDASRCECASASLVYEASGEFPGDGTSPKKACRRAGLDGPSRSPSSFWTRAMSEGERGDVGMDFCERGSSEAGGEVFLRCCVWALLCAK